MKFEIRKLLSRKIFFLLVFVVIMVCVLTLNVLGMNKDIFLSGIPTIISEASTNSWHGWASINIWKMGFSKNRSSLTTVSPNSKILQVINATTTANNNISIRPTAKPQATSWTTKINTTSKISNQSRISTKKPQKLTTRTKNFICLNLMGRMGNLMFQYASGYGIARSKGMDVVISEKQNLVKIFHLHQGARVVKDTSICKGVKTISEARASAYDKKTTNFKNNSNVALFGYLQSYKYFEKFSDELRSQFTFQESIQKKAQKVLRNIFQKHLENKNNTNQKWTFVSVHVRRGDMLNNAHGYLVATSEYFYRTQMMFRDLFKNVLFVVCSNDINWCKANLRVENTYFVTGNSPEVDMAILSSCNHTISSVGSFSWWSAWLSKGIVTYYFPPAKERSSLRSQYSKDYSDYFLSKWIKVA